jgi:hypothetical protein
MEAATVARSAAAAAPARVPRGRPAPGRKPRKPRKPRSSVAAARATTAAPARKPRAAGAPARAPRTRTRTAPARRAGAQLIPIAVSTASAVRQLPDSTLMVRMARGRLWIGVLGVLLAGIVGLNVFTLSLTATAGQIDQNIVALEKENSLLRGIDAKRSGSARVRHDAAALGLEMAAVDQVTSLQPRPDDVAVAVKRLAAAGSGY